MAEAEALAALSDVSLGDDIAKRCISFTRNKLGTTKEFLTDLDIKGGVLDQFVETLLEQSHNK